MLREITPTEGEYNLHTPKDTHIARAYTLFDYGNHACDYGRLSLFFATNKIAASSQFIQPEKLACTTIVSQRMSA